MTVTQSMLHVFDTNMFKHLLDLKLANLNLAEANLFSNGLKFAKKLIHFTKKMLCYKLLAH